MIETLQTLACTGAENDNPNDNIAQFLENLRKEQAEKYVEFCLVKIESQQPNYIQNISLMSLFLILAICNYIGSMTSLR